MGVEFNKSTSGLSARVEGEMTIYTAAEIKPLLLSLIDGTEEAELDLSRVSEIDTAGLQLLLLIKQEASRKEKVLRFSGHSPAVVASLDLCNLAAVFGDQVVLSSHS